MTPEERAASQRRMAEYVRLWQEWDRRAKWRIRIDIAVIAVALVIAVVGITLIVRH